MPSQEIYRRSTCEFENEHGTKIEMSVTHFDDGHVRIEGASPRSRVDHTWTLIEAFNLYVCLGEALRVSRSYFSQADILNGDGTYEQRHNPLPANKIPEKDKICKM